MGGTYGTNNCRYDVFNIGYNVFTWMESDSVSNWGDGYVQVMENIL